MGPILGKRVVAIGGGFSSGKSSFLNSFLGGESLLPIDTLPTTAVPAYLISGTEEKASGLNLFRERISLSLRMSAFLPMRWTARARRRLDAS